MAGSAGAMSALTGPLVRVGTDNIVSSSSMVSRAVLRDSWLGLLVAAPDESLWLAATSDALAPEPEGLIVRGAASGGPPVEYGSPRLLKVSLQWGSIAGGEVLDGEAEVANPVVVNHPRGASVAVVRLAKARQLTESIDTGNGPTPVRLTDEPGPVAAIVDVLTLLADDDGRHWPVLRTAAVVSESGFLGEPGAVAMDLELQKADSGALAFDDGELAGLVRPLGQGLSLLVPVAAIAETIVHARS